MKTKGIKEVFSKLLTNKIVLSIVFFLALFNVIYYIIGGYLNAFIFYVILAIIITYFSKNMIIVLGVPLILVNFFVLGQHNMKSTSKEGMTTSDSSGNAVEKAKIAENVIQNKQGQTSGQRPQKNFSTSSSQGLPITPLDNNVNTGPSTTDESFQNGGRTKGKQYKVDYASTVEEAYDNLNQILGSDGIKNLTSDTQNLMKQQVQLAESMKNMAPIIQGMAPLMKQAEGLLGSMNENGGLSSIANIANKLTGSLGGKKPDAQETAPVK